MPQLISVSMSSGKARTFGSNKFMVYNCLVMSNVLSLPAKGPAPSHAPFAASLLSKELYHQLLGKKGG